MFALKRQTLVQLVIRKSGEKSSIKMDDSIIHLIDRDHAELLHKVLEKHIVLFDLTHVADGTVDAMYKFKLDGNPAAFATSTSFYRLLLNAISIRTPELSSLLIRIATNDHVTTFDDPFFRSILRALVAYAKGGKRAFLETLFSNVDDYHRLVPYHKVVTEVELDINKKDEIIEFVQNYGMNGLRNCIMHYADYVNGEENTVCGSYQFDTSAILEYSIAKTRAYADIVGEDTFTPVTFDQLKFATPE